MNSVVLNRTRQAPAEDTPAFGGIAERFRRAGDLNRAIALCREGLERFPDLISARVTLGWALLDSGHPVQARDEFAFVLHRAPDNLAALRGMAMAFSAAEGHTEGARTSSHGTQARTLQALERFLRQVQYHRLALDSRSVA